MILVRIPQETFYDLISRTILIRELDARGTLVRAEGYVYDNKGRRSHSVDEQGRITKYGYDSQSRLQTVWYPYSEALAQADQEEAAGAGLFFTLDKGSRPALYLYCRRTHCPAVYCPSRTCRFLKKHIG